jgi:hypothetical protein
MTYAESAELMQDPIFRGRIKVASLKYADNLLTSPPTGPGSNALIGWAKQTFTSPDQAAMLIQPAVVMDPAVQTNGSGILDPNLQAAAEAVVKKML